MMLDRLWSAVLTVMWGALVFAWLWPASWWLDVRSVTVLDGVAGISPRMVVDRSIRRPFHAEVDVVVRALRAGGGTQVICPTGIGGGDYRPDAVLPDDLDLDWWSYGACPTLPPGRYIVTTTWVIRPAFGPEKVVRIESPPFSIRPAMGSDSAKGLRRRA